MSPSYRACLSAGSGATQIYTNQRHEMGMKTEHDMNGMFVQKYDHILTGNSGRHEGSSERLKIHHVGHSFHSPPAARH
jgi:hypothetical protein